MSYQKYDNGVLLLLSPYIASLKLIPASEAVQHRASEAPDFRWGAAYCCRSPLRYHAAVRPSNPVGALSEPHPEKARAMTAPNRRAKSDESVGVSPSTMRA